MSAPTASEASSRFVAGRELRPEQQAPFPALAHLGAPDAPGVTDIAGAADPLIRARAAWAATAHLIAGRNRMRVSRDGGKTYRLRDERLITAEVPNQPAAVLIYDQLGSARTLCLDFDSSRGGPAAVRRDAAAIAALLRRSGLSFVADASPSAGAHVYVPLPRPMALHEIRPLMGALGRRLPSLDPQPMLNIAAGCIRPPGARHKSGGHQSLDGSVEEARSVFTRGNETEAWLRFVEEIGAVPAAADQPRIPASVVADPEPRLEPLAGFNEPSASFQSIARTGQWDEAAYRTPSEARQAVIWAAAASGMSMPDLARRVEDGTWPGLASLYARYGTGRRAALVRDWRKAVAFERRRRSATKAQPAAGVGSVQIRTTSPHQTQGRTGVAPSVAVRVWLAAVDFICRDQPPAVKAVLYALAQAAALSDSLEVEHGNRSLAIATGLDQSTVGRVLAQLREAPADRLLIRLIREADGPHAHRYELLVPPLIRAACEKKPWRRGRIYAVRPAFRAIGLTCAFVYTALEQAREPLDGRTLARLAGVGHAAAYEALSTLASFGLADRNRAGWLLGHADLNRLAEAWGCLDEVAAQVDRYRRERRDWWMRLGLWHRLVDSPLDPPLDSPPGSPPGRWGHGSSGNGPDDGPGGVVLPLRPVTDQPPAPTGAAALRLLVAALDARVISTTGPLGP